MTIICSHILPSVIKMAIQLMDGCSKFSCCTLKITIDCYAPINVNLGGGRGRPGRCGGLIFLKNSWAKSPPWSSKYRSI